MFSFMHTRANNFLNKIFFIDKYLGHTHVHVHGAQMLRYKYPTTFEK